MSPDIETLRSYVDAELPPQRRMEVEAAIAADAELAAQVEALSASRLPYLSAFAQERLAPVPAALQQRIAELSAVAAASHDMALAAVGHGAGPAGGGQQPGRAGDARLIWLGLLLLGLIVGYLAATHVARSAAPDAEPWVLKVASYHSMYARETVMEGGIELSQTKALQRRLQQKGLVLQIPDLQAKGLRFVRAQQLQFEGRMVLQLVYLPQEGLPIALCLTPAPEQPERSTAVDGLQTLTWHAGGWAYVLVGSLLATDMQNIKRGLPAVLI